MAKLKIYPHLSKLKICNNKLEDFEELKVLNTLKDLHFLDLTENPITKKPDYRPKIFEILPNLVYLDYVNQKGENFSETDEDEEEEEEEENEESFIVDDQKEEEEEEGEEEEENEENEGKEFKKKKTE